MDISEVPAEVLEHDTLIHVIVTFVRIVRDVEILRNDGLCLRRRNLIPTALLCLEVDRQSLTGVSQHDVCCLLANAISLVNDLPYAAVEMRTGYIDRGLRAFL